MWNRDAVFLRLQKEPIGMRCCHGGSGCDPGREAGCQCRASGTCVPRTYERAQGQIAVDQGGPRQGIAERGRDRRIGESQGPYGMAVLFAAQEPGRARQADTCQHVGDRVSSLIDGDGVCSIRFAPPLVISEEELETAMRRIEECLYDFDKVRGCCIDML